MIDIEHAILNYADGFSIKKFDDNEIYRFSASEPCKLDFNNKTDDDAIEELLMNKIRPVCGWIVCIAGPRKGKDYKIHAGKNFVGRADDMAIQVLGDNKISRRNHAVLYAPIVLSGYDVIEMGDSKFLFIPFCGEHFR